jgi:hypothetical protein
MNVRKLHDAKPVEFGREKVEGNLDLSYGETVEGVSHRDPAQRRAAQRYTPREKPAQRGSSSGIGRLRWGTVPRASDFQEQ